MRIGFSVFLVFSFFLCDAQVVSIADVQGSVSASPYDGDVVSVKGQVTGIVSTGYVLMDKMEAWSGIFVYDPSRDPMPTLGDSVLVEGTVKEYYEMTELTDVSEYSIISEGNAAPDPISLDITDIDESWESCYIRLEDVSCSNTDLGYGEWELSDGGATIVVDDLGVQFQPEIDQNYNITASVFYSFGAYKLEPSFLSDIEINAPVYFTKGVKPVNIDESSITLYWETNVAASSRVSYGLSETLELGKVEVDNQDEEHVIVIDGLDAGQFYYIQVVSKLGSDSAKSATELYTTASNSSGEIKHWFNDVAELGDASNLSTSLLDTIELYLDAATQSIDVAMYDFDNHALEADQRNESFIQTLNEAYDRGVKVRLITDDEPENLVLNDLNSGIPILKGNAGGIMHDKFIIIDAESTTEAWVLSGSTNLNYNNLTIDYNNVIAIQDVALAQAFVLEFNEMWGSEGLSPVETSARFGADKEDNTPHYFSIGEKRVELWFSPSDGTAYHIQEKLDSAKSSIDFAIMAFTEDMLANSLVKKYKEGVAVSGIIDYVEYSGSEFEKLLRNDIAVYDYKNYNGLGWPDFSTVHHKFAVVDTGEADACVITGSHNWTASANSKHDENTLIIYDNDLAYSYTSEIDRIRNKILTPLCYDDTLYSEGCVQVSFNLFENDYIYGDDFRLFFEGDNWEIEVDENNNCSWYTPCACGENAEYCFTIKYFIEYGNNAQYLDSAYLYAYVNIGAVEGNQSDLIRVYPNPVSEHINIKSEAGYSIQSIRLVNIMGQELMFEEYDGAERVQLNIGNFDRGIYFMSIDLDIGTIVEKLVFDDN